MAQGKQPNVCVIVDTVLVFQDCCKLKSLILILFVFMKSADHVELTEKGYKHHFLKKC